MTLPLLTPAQKEQLINAFQEIGHMHPKRDWGDPTHEECFWHEGNVSLAELWHFYEVCAQIHAEINAS